MRRDESSYWAGIWPKVLLRSALDIRVPALYFAFKVSLKHQGTSTVLGHQAGCVVNGDIMEREVAGADAIVDAAALGSGEMDDDLVRPVPFQDCPLF